MTESIVTASPVVPPVLFDNISAELKAFPQWVLWRYELVKDKWSKVPWRADLRYKASPTNPADWSTFADARAACVRSHGYGLGFVLADSDPFACFDLDAIKNLALTTEQKNEIMAEQKRLWEQAGSTYGEKSPSGEGYHGWLKAKLPRGHSVVWKLHAEKVCELYSREHFMTMTGAVVTAAPIADCQAFAEHVVSLCGPSKAAPAGPPLPDRIEVLTDDEIWTKCVQASTGDTFKELWEGRWQELAIYPSQSEADQALMNYIAFWTDNRTQCGRVFCKSALNKRNKGKAYVTRTVNKSFDKKVPPIDPVLAAKLTEEIKQRIQVQKVEVDANNYQDWAQPPGMVGKIAGFIYYAAPSPLKEVALAGAITYYAGLMGRAYTVSNMALHQYTVVLAKSGQGKEAAKSGINRINRAVKEMLGEGIDIYNYMGPDYIASSQGLYNRLHETPCMASFLGDVGIWFQTICSKKAKDNDKQLSRALLNLYGQEWSGSSAHADKIKNLKTIDRPAFSFMGESTPLNFYKAVEEEDATSGFLPRVTLIEYNGDCPEPNENPCLIPDAGMIQLLQSQIRQNVNNAQSNTIIPVAYDAEADAFQKDLRKKCRLTIDEHNRNNEDHLAVIWTRVHAKTIKLAALIAVGVNSIEPVITLADIEWAEKLVMRGAHKLIERFKAGDVGQSNWQHEQTKLVKAQLHIYTNAQWTPKFGDTYRVGEEAKRNGIMHIHYLNANAFPRAPFKNSPDLKRAVDNTIGLLIDAGTLELVGPYDMMRGNRKGKMYRIVGS